MTLSTRQIGKCGEILVQYELLLRGIESAPLTTDSGIDLVAFSPKRKDAVTIQVKTNRKAKPGGGKGKPALDWWVSDDSPADLLAFVDLESRKVWLVDTPKLATLAQQHSSNRYHLYMVVDPSVKPRKDGKRIRQCDFER